MIPPRSLNLIEESLLYDHLLKHSHFQILLIFATDEQRIMLGMAFHCCFGEAH